MRLVRRIHVWLGVFFAPAILFFAVTGAVMTLGLHKTKGGFEAIPVLARMAEIHRKQNAFPAAPGAAKATSEKPAGDKSQSEKPSAESRAKLLFRAFVVVMAVGLVVTTLLGLVMAFAQKRDRLRLTCALLLGLILPIVILLVSPVGKAWHHAVRSRDRSPGVSADGARQDRQLVMARLADEWIAARARVKMT